MSQVEGCAWDVAVLRVARQVRGAPPLLAFLYKAGWAQASKIGVLDSVSRGGSPVCALPPSGS